ncbi:PhzF family phenazine biosynthesis protein [Polaromonas naphthalenivorans]|uniref:Phenazine biosynthesis protein PhzF family n=1 Tax=Polaromonas naphthalenivorans (strain CJ2) TaxID=365044 RepID=A1VJ95_POLNA|nr:PhzF family phenazine biosynthesis protein [Polaromonas naphthalenivorans]ABM35723.1 phenazine biosynthesis protein PhzF family [Polaromonas naphthalenivorans CJ2]
MTPRLFKQVDVFTSTPYLGNPLAVVLDGSGLDDEAMQRFARWTNLSETTFLLPPADASADYRVRIFTPGGELPFAGHPTLGSCHAWLQAGGQPKSRDFIVQECQVGLVKVRREGPRLAFAAPPLRRSAPSPMLLPRVAAALGLKAHQILAVQQLDNGPVWLGLLLDSPDTVLQLNINHLALQALQVHIGVAAVYPAAEAAPLIARANREARAFGQTPLPTATLAQAPDLEVRAIVASTTVYEDPVTGSLNAGLAQWLMADGHMPERYLASQGLCLGRAGQVHLERDAQGQVWVGGDSVTCIDGQVMLGSN